MDFLCFVCFLLLVVLYGETVVSPVSLTPGDQQVDFCPTHWRGDRGVAWGHPWGGGLLFSAGCQSLKWSYRV